MQRCWIVKKQLKNNLNAHSIREAYWDKTFHGKQFGFLNSKGDQGADSEKNKSLLVEISPPFRPNGLQGQSPDYTGQFQNFLCQTNDG